MSCDVSEDRYRLSGPRQQIIAPHHRRKTLALSARTADALLALVGSIACAAAALLSTAGFFTP
jgi:hypothetical protein